MELKPACSRTRNFLWMMVCLAAFTVRTDMAGVTSFVRALGLRDYCYGNLLDFFHSPSLNLDKLTLLWTKLCMRLFNPLQINNRLVLLADGIKIAKEGRKMPAVKSLHQESDSNSKAEYIMGHSCQAIALLVGALESFFAVPLISRIHEGLVFSNRDSKTLLDKMIVLIQSLSISEPFYFVADAYYAARPIIRGLLKQSNHLISRLKSNAVAYYLVEPQAKTSSRGRPKKYGNKIKVKDLFKDIRTFLAAQSPVYGEKNITIQYRALSLLWRHVGITASYVLVIHPVRGRIMLLSTDLTLSPLEVIKLYGLRYKIEFSFKQALRVLGTYSYHFWMSTMDKISRRSGDQYLHHKSKKYRESVKRKIAAYHRYIQLGLIAQGLLQYLSCTLSNVIWKKFGSWIRTIRPGIPPSEQVTAIAMKHTLPEFLVDVSQESIFKKFLWERIDFDRAEGLRLAG